MNTTTDKNSLIQRIQKLLALADASRNPNEHEVQAAAAKVQQLLQEYGLSMAQVEAEGGKSDAGDREQAAVDRRAMFKWQRDLMAAIAENFFCYHMVKEMTVKRIYREGFKKSLRHVLIGRAVNIAVAVEMYDYLSKAIARVAVENGHDLKARDTVFFFDGAVSRIAERLRTKRRDEELRQAEERAARARAAAAAGGGSTGTALVLTDVYTNEQDLNRDFLNGYEPGTSARMRREEEARQARQMELEQSGMDWVEAFYVSKGYSPEKAKELADKYHKADRSAGRSSRGRTDHRANRQYASSAYHSGREAGKKIGLDTQIGAGKTRVEGGK